MKTITKQTYAIFWQHSRRYGWLVVFIVVAHVGVTAADITVPLLFKRLFNLLTELGATERSQAFSRLLGILFGVAALHGISWLFHRLQNFSGIRFYTFVMRDLVNTCFEYLHQHSSGFFLNRFVGALVRKVNRLVDAFEGIADGINDSLFPMALRLSAVVAVLFYHNILIATVIVLWVALYLAVNYAFTVYKLKYDEARAAADSETTGYLADTITNSSTIKLFSAFRHESKGFRGLVERQRGLHAFTWMLDEYMWAIQGFFTIVIEFFVLYLALHFWANRSISVGDIVLLQAYLLQVFDPLWRFGNVVRGMYRRLADAEEMVEILTTPHDIKDKPRAKKLAVRGGTIEFQNVTFTYTKTREVIKNLDLKIAPGERVGLVGPSGAGKSTITALILRFYDVTEGAILIDGQNIADVTQESLRQNIAYVPQDPILFHRALMENIRYGRRDATDKEVVRAAKLAHCDEFIAKLSDGYNTYVGERGIKLSGGERQRVAIARAILKNAPILVLDEATSSLDSHAEALIQDALAKLMEGKTTIVIAHRLSTIMKMDRIVVMQEGKIHETGTHQELLGNAGGLYKKLWELQAGGFIK